jgi:uncharacterized repeat protein (TIGR03803 family)
MHNRRVKYTPAFILLVLAALVSVHSFAPCASAQEKPIYSFMGGADGNIPGTGVILDKQGNLYGTTQNGGNLPACEGFGCGTVFKLTQATSGKWKKTILYDLAGGTADGSAPSGPLIFGKDESLFGTAYYGGTGICDTGGNFATCGIVFQLSRGASGSWSEIVLYSFQGGTDAAGPGSGLISDTAGNLYGTTIAGGGATGSDCPSDGCGAVYELSAKSDGSWTEKVLYSFQGGADGAFPIGDLVRDAKGNLFGVTLHGGSTPCYFGTGCGTVFELQNSPTGWVKSTIYQFVGGSDGMGPSWGLAIDAKGNLYGTTEYGGGLVLSFGYGTVFELSPESGGSWSEAVLHAFTGKADGGIPVSGVILDSAGNLYGTSLAGGSSTAGNGGGAAFKLTATSGGEWTLTTLHDFLTLTDGAQPGPLTRNPSGGFYGTTSYGGAQEYGTVFELNP